MYSFIRLLFLFLIFFSNHPIHPEKQSYQKSYTNTQTKNSQQTHKTRKRLKNEDIIYFNIEPIYQSIQGYISNSCTVPKKTHNVYFIIIFTVLLYFKLIINNLRLWLKVLILFRDRLQTFLVSL